ncbi:MAG: hypothetical protein JW785_09085 [Acidimicrobiia bacterium]|nr:hypothetical protein [Acidimicrobiia bacterium]
MLAYERRARWIRRMQDRAGRRREREWARHAAYAPYSTWVFPTRGDGTARAA